MFTTSSFDGLQGGNFSNHEVDNTNNIDAKNQNNQWEQDKYAPDQF